MEKNFLCDELKIYFINLNFILNFILFIMSEGDEKVKRTHEEIEIDLTQQAPLSKKQKRLLRKGKLDLEKKHENEIKKQKKQEREHEEIVKETKEKEVKYGVWVGNFSFDTTREDIFRYIVAKTAQYEDDDEEGESKNVKVTEKDILRINLPTQKDSKKIKGFAYIDFRTKNQQLTVLTQLNETNLNGRNLLIKDSTSFEGRPEKPLSKNPPSRILFVGNLSFDTTNELLTSQFQHCGEISKIRMATFEDTGKCKGFAFIDFKDEEGPTKALKDKSSRKLLGRLLRLEYGEDRSKKTPKRFQREESEGEVPEIKPIEEESKKEKPKTSPKEFKPKLKKPIRERHERPLASVALANAQRASAAIVKSTGKKITFD